MSARTHEALTPPVPPLPRSEGAGGERVLPSPALGGRGGRGVRVTSRMGMEGPSGLAVAATPPSR